MSDRSGTPDHPENATVTVTGYDLLICRAVSDIRSGINAAVTADVDLHSMETDPALAHLPMVAYVEADGTLMSQVDTTPADRTEACTF